MNRNHHSYIDEHEIKILPKEHLTPGSLLIQEYPNIKYAQYHTAKSDAKLAKPQLNITNYPFYPGQLLSIYVELSNSGKSIRISITDDTTFNIIYIYQVRL